MATPSVGGWYICENLEVGRDSSIFENFIPFILSLQNENRLVNLESNYFTSSWTLDKTKYEKCFFKFLHITSDWSNGGEGRWAWEQQTLEGFNKTRMYYILGVFLGWVFTKNFLARRIRSYLKQWKPAPNALFSLKTD